jgi:cytochrome c-type biogenesis protein CcmH
MTHPEAAAPPPLKGRPQWTGKAGSTGPLGLSGSCVAWVLHAVRRFAALALWLLAASVALPAAAKEAEPAAADPVLEARLLSITAELRCLVCQNQTIADSHAGLAVDLRNQVREMLQRGESDEQIIAYMTARYGDFVLYRPPLKGTTAALWFGPAALLVLGAGVLVFTLRRRSRMRADQFEPEEPDEPQAAR